MEEQNCEKISLRGLRTAQEADRQPYILRFHNQLYFNLSIPQDLLRQLTKIRHV